MVPRKCLDNYVCLNPGDQQIFYDNFLKFRVTVSESAKAGLTSMLQTFAEDEAPHFAISLVDGERLGTCATLSISEHHLLHHFPTLVPVP